MFRFPGEKPKLSAAELNRQNEAADRSAFSRRGLTEHQLDDDQQSHWVWIRNDSGADRQRFECMALGQPLFDLLPDGTVDLIFSADTADADETPVILLEPIADGAFGKGVIHGLAIALVGPGEPTDSFGDPDPDNHWIEPGAGSIKLLGQPGPDEGEVFDEFFNDFFDDFFDTDLPDGSRLLPVLLGAAAGGMILAKTPAGGIPAASGTGPYIWGSATCTRVGDDGVVGSETITITNIVNQAIAANVVIKAAKVGAIYVVDVASCGV